MRKTLSGLCHALRLGVAGLTALVPGAPSVQAAGQLDPSFGVSRGYSVLPLNQGGLDRDLATAIGLRPDGRLVLAGTIQTLSAPVAGLYQVTKQGLPDASFGRGDGKATFVDPSEPDLALAIRAIALQDDGKVLIAGARRTPPPSVSGTDAVVLRVLADGSGLDPGFGTSGVVVIGEMRDVYAIALDYADRVVLVGETPVTYIPPGVTVLRVGVGRLLSDGSLDSAFAQDGLTYFAFPSGGYGEAWGRGVIVQADGKLVAGATIDSTDHGLDFGALRLNDDGTLDTSFGNLGPGGGPNGYSRVFFDTASSTCSGEQLTAMVYRRSALFPTWNRIVLGGTACPSGGDPDFAVAQLLPDGALDAGFGVAGKTTLAFDLGGSNGDSLKAMALETIGLALGGPTHILLVGSAQTASSSNLFDLALARLDGSGFPDPGFGIGGKAVIGIDQGGANGDMAEAVVVSRGRAFLAGWTQTDLNAGNDIDFLVASVFASDLLFADGFER